ncbi:MAG: hypothetical protein WD069_09295 [Planctomycetales bacterium]
MLLALVRTIASYRRATAERQLLITDDGPSIDDWLPVPISSGWR